LPLSSPLTHILCCSRELVKIETENIAPIGVFREEGRGARGVFREVENLQPKSEARIGLRIISRGTID
jgi:hypothetical protein